jgi:hypothetical protein
MPPLGQRWPFRRRRAGGVEVAQVLVKFMSSPEAAPLMRKSGMEPLH